MTCPRKKIMTCPRKKSWPDPRKIMTCPRILPQESKRWHWRPRWRRIGQVCKESALKHSDRLFDYLIFRLFYYLFAHNHDFYLISSETQLWNLQKLLCLRWELNNCDSYSNKIKVFRCCQKKQKVDQICLRNVTSWKLTQVIQCWFIQKEKISKESFPVIQNFVQRRKCRPSSCLKENTRAAT